MLASNRELSKFVATGSLGPQKQNKSSRFYYVQNSQFAKEPYEKRTKKGLFDIEINSGLLSPKKKYDS